VWMVFPFFLLFFGVCFLMTFPCPSIHFLSFSNNIYNLFIIMFTFKDLFIYVFNVLEKCMKLECD
jgi:hypothetical protein